ncbi:MAG: hypothetical protein IPO74_00925 [Thermomonas sp.]|nr:hypothetical protein [Thermomonas sp.]
MFAQLLCYVQDARKKGETIPPFLAVIDREKAALMETAKAFPLLADTAIKWPKSGSKVKEIERVALQRSFAAQMAPYIETHFVVYKLDSHEREFIDAVKHAIKAGKLVRTPITPDNLRQVFDKWVDMIGRELEGVDEVDYALLFFADIMHDGSKAAMANLPARLLHEGDQPLFLLNGKTYELSSDKGYRNFWAIYHRPPEEEHRAYLLERRDSLLPLDGAASRARSIPRCTSWTRPTTYWPRRWARTGRNTTSCGTCAAAWAIWVKVPTIATSQGTLDQADVDVMKASRTCVAAHKFQYDYLNDDVTPEGQIDYALTNKVPAELRQAIADAKAGKAGAKKILVLMNPPYAEAMSVDNTTAANGKNAEAKQGVAQTRIAESMGGLGYAARELFVQFLVRIRRELPDATIAMFSTLKYVNAPNFPEFRSGWTARYLNGFVVHSKAFDGLKGDFPIGFLVWDTSKNDPAEIVLTKVLDKDGLALGEKAFSRTEEQARLSEWIVRPRSNKQPALPLKNAITPTTSSKDVRGDKWADDAIGSMMVFGNDFAACIEGDGALVLDTVTPGRSS